MIRSVSGLSARSLHHRRLEQPAILDQLADPPRGTERLARDRGDIMELSSAWSATSGSLASCAVSSS